MRRTEIAVHALLHVPPFLGADHQNFLAMKACHAANDGGIVSEAAIAVNLAEISEETLDVIERLRPLGMPRQLRFLPGSLHAFHFLSKNVNALLQLRQLLPGFLTLPGVCLDQRHLTLDPIEFLLRLLNWVHEFN